MTTSWGHNALGPDPGPRPDLAKLTAEMTAEMTARIDGHRIDGDGATWEASPGDRPDEITLTRLTQDGAVETRTVRIRLEER